MSESGDEEEEHVELPTNSIRYNELERSLYEKVVRCRLLLHKSQ